MHNVGGELYDYDSFKTLCKSSKIIDSLVDEYTETGIFLNKEREESKAKDKDIDDAAEKAREKKISTAAKRAAKKALKKDL